MAIITHYPKLTSLQQQILVEISKGVKSKSAIARKLGKKYPDVHDAVKILNDKGLIKQKGERQGRGLKEKFYILTDEGIEKVISFKVSLADFWRMIFFVFDQNTGHELKKLDINRIFSMYQKEVLRYPRDLVTPLFDLIPSLARWLKKSNHVSETIIGILIVLAEQGSLTKPEIINKLKKRHIFYPKQFDALIKKLNELLIVENDKKSRYQLTHLGLLLFFIEAYDKLGDKTAEKDGIRRRIKTAVENHTDLFPLIFNKWRLLREIYDDTTLVSIFRIILKDERTTFSQPLQIGGIYEIFKSLNAMRDVFVAKMKEELDVAKDVLKEWLVSNDLGELEPKTLLDDTRMGYMLLGGKSIAISPFGEIIHKINELEVFSMLDLMEDITILNQKLFLSYRLDITKKNLESLVSFLFYTVLLSWLRVQVNVLSFISLHEKENIHTKLDIEKKKKAWEFFLKQNPDLVNWYHDCIEEIIKFEKQNTDIMMELGKFSIEASDQRKQLDIAFARKLSSLASAIRS